MELSAIRKQIKEKKLDPFYVFVGEETAIMDIYINKIAECMGVKPVRADSVASIMPRLTNTSFLSKAQCFVVRDDADFMKQEKLWSDFISGKVQKNNVLIIASYTLDKRSKFYKTVKSTIAEFNALNEQIMTQYIAKEIALSDTNIHKLIGVCENSYGRALLEIDKIKTYQDATGSEVNHCFIELLKDGTIYQPPTDAIWKFIDAVMHRKPSASFKYLDEAYAFGEATLVLLSNMYRVAKHTLQVQSCESTDIAKVTGLTQWEINNARHFVNNYRNGELVRIMRTVREVEKGIKIGTIADELAVMYVLVNIF